MATRSQVVSDLVSMGLDKDLAKQLVGALAAQTPPQRKAERAAFVVDILEGEQAEQFGDVQISKVMSNGKIIPKIGVFKQDLAGLIKALQAAGKQLSES